MDNYFIRTNYRCDYVYFINTRTHRNKFYGFTFFDSYSVSSTEHYFQFGLGKFLIASVASSPIFFLASSSAFFLASFILA